MEPTLSESHPGTTASERPSVRTTPTCLRPPAYALKRSEGEKNPSANKGIISFDHDASTLETPFLRPDGKRNRSV